MINIDLIVGCRPNFVKAAAIMHAAKQFPQIKIRLIHTGQHGEETWKPLFKDLELGDPDYVLEHDDNSFLGPQVRFGMMIVDLAHLWASESRPQYVMVVGDTDSTLAGAIAAKKEFLQLIHVEAGLRCGDPKMQEEINRKAVDSISDIMYATTWESSIQLKAEGHEPWNVRMVGNVMADTLLRFKDKAIAQGVGSYDVNPREYALLTVHRAENVHDPKRIYHILEGIEKVCTEIPILFPMHPRHHVDPKGIPGLLKCDPLGYIDFVAAMVNAKFVITDSGGVQEETTILGVPCLTIRNNTERPETCHKGTNKIVGTDPWAIYSEAEKILKAARMRPYEIPEKWDGHAAERILKDIITREACR